MSRVEEEMIAVVDMMLGYAIGWFGNDEFVLRAHFQITS